MMQRAYHVHFQAADFYDLLATDEDSPIWLVYAWKIFCTVATFCLAELKFIAANC